jgi:carbamoyl-phosphate synthase small subunit
LQGIEIENKNAFGFQGHPEASPGPQDLMGLFNKFIKMLKNK